MDGFGWMDLDWAEKVTEKLGKETRERRYKEGIGCGGVSL